MMEFQKPRVITEPLDKRYERMYLACSKEIEKGLQLHLESPTQFKPEKCSLRCLDTCVTTLPTGSEKGVYYAVDFGGTNMRVIRIDLLGSAKSHVSQLKSNIRISSPVATGFPKGLLDSRATATMLFDAIAQQVKNLMTTEGDLQKGEMTPLGFAFSFAIDQKKLNSAILKNWTKGFETGTKTKDPVIGRDVCTLLDVACSRLGVPAVVVASLNDTTGTLLSAAYDKPLNWPQCLVGVILGTGMNGCYFQPNAEEYGYQGCLINTELGNFDKELPWNIIDIEVDFASVNRGSQRLEKMMAGMYLPELCRRVVIKIFQSEAPTLAWTHESITGECCSSILNDESPDFATTRKVIAAMWDWTPPTTYIRMIKTIFTQIFERSAALAAAVIAAMAMQTGYLQPAMGGLTVGIDGSLYTQNECYAKMMEQRLIQILGEDTAELIHFVRAEDGSGKGAAILAACVELHQEKVMKTTNRRLR